MSVERQTIMIRRLDSMDRGSFQPALRDLLLKEEVSETLADVLFGVMNYAKGAGSDVIRIPGSEIIAVRAEVRRLLVLDESEPLTELFKYLYQRLGSAAPR